MKLHFPHISRIFSAFCLWSLLLALISFNVFLRITKPLAYSDKIIDVFTHPFSALAHENFAQTLQSSGAQTRAGEEFALVAELSPVLGADTTAHAVRRETEKNYWQNIAAGRPDYRDAYIQLAALAYHEGNLAGAHAYLLKAQTLDPNNATVNRLLTFTSKLLE